MGKITINVPDDQMERVLKAFTSGQAGIPAPGYSRPTSSKQTEKEETDLDITKRKISDYILSVVKSYEVSQAAARAQAEAAERVDQELTLT